MSCFLHHVSVLEHVCNTVACICGWAHHISDGKAFPELSTIPSYKIAQHLEKRLPRELTKEVFGINYPTFLEYISIETAARNLRHYLTTGEGLGYDSN